MPQVFKIGSYWVYFWSMEEFLWRNQILLLILFVHKKFTIKNEKSPIKGLQFMGDCVIIVKVSES